MTNSNNKLIKQIAEEFSSEFLSLPITVLPNEDIVYGDYLIKKTNSRVWELYNISNHFLLSKFYLRSCALLAAHYYEQYMFTSYHEVKLFDREYNKNKVDSIFFKHHLKETKDFDQKVILLNRLECSEEGVERYRRKISMLFNRAFV